MHLRMPDKFDILAADLKQLNASGAEVGMFGEEVHSYELNPVLTANEVSTFEHEHDVRLPDDYRQFITRVGNGGAGPYYGLFALGEMDDGDDFGPWDNFIGELSSPFPHIKAWNNVSDKPEYQGAGDDERFDPLIEEFDERYFDPRHVCGAIPICHLGCARRQWLVVTGPEAGNVWCDDRADYKGLYPLRSDKHDRVTFYEWYRGWLDEAMSKLKVWQNNSRA